MERPLHAAIKKTARLNQLQKRIVIHGECTCERLNKLLRPGSIAQATLVVLDCEGAEDYLHTFLNIAV